MKTSNKKKRNFGVDKISIILTIFLAVLFMYAFLRGTDSDHWQKEYKKVKLSAMITNIKKVWGTPDQEYANKSGDSIVLEYQKGNGYKFLFDRKTNLLGKKMP